MFQRTPRKSVSSANAKSIHVSDILTTISDVSCLMEIVEAAKNFPEILEIFTLYHLHARSEHLNEMREKLESGEFTVAVDINETSVILKQVDSNWIAKGLPQQIKEMKDLVQLAVSTQHAFPAMLSSVVKIYEYNMKKNAEEISHAMVNLRKDSALKGPESPVLRRLKTEERLALETYPLIRP